MTSIRHTVTLPAGRERIDRYLASVLRKDYSRRELQAALKEGRLCLNGKPAKAKAQVRTGDVISGEVAAVRETRLRGETIPLMIVYEDESLLVVDKPAGLVVHPGAGHSQGTLAHALVGKGLSLSSLGGEFRPGIVHRLDKETSGLLAVAKNNRVHRKLQAQLKMKSFEKTYVALAAGRVDYEEGHITQPIGRDPKNRKKMAVLKNLRSAGRSFAKDAETYYKVLERLRRSTLLRLRIKTGRTHQIRVHLASLGHPVVGDGLYGKSVPGFTRHALHASEIKFSHPETLKEVSLKSPLPEDFEALMKKFEESDE